MEVLNKVKIDMNATKESERKILGYSREEINNVVNAMNLLLANYHVHYQKLRNYHWNVKGGDFFDIHEQFEIQYNTAKSNIDEIAERIRVFKSTPLSMLREYLEFSEIKETGTDLSADEMVREILNDYEILLKHMDAIVKIAAKNDDSGTEDLIKSFIKDLEKHHWMLTAFSA